MAATKGNAGELNLLGITEHLVLDKYPAILPGCVVAFKFRFEHGEAGEKKIEVRIADLDGQAIAKPLPLGFVPQFSDGVICATAQNFFELRQLKIPRPGEYRIEMIVNDVEFAAIPVHFCMPT
jgi:hypothetical protein